MTAPTPLKKANELIESINEMVFGGANNDRIEEIVTAANKMKEIGQYTDAYNVLGMIAALHADSGEVDRLFTAAIRSGGRVPWTLGNYATALSNLDRHGDAVRIIDEVVELAQDDLSVIKKAIKLHQEAFDIDGVRELMARCKALGHPIVDLTMENQLGLIEELMAEHNVMWPDVASRIELASGVLHQFGLVPQNSQKIDEDSILVYEFRIKGDVDSVSRAENAINDAIAEKPYSHVDDFLYFTCSTI